MEKTVVSLLEGARRVEIGRVGQDAHLVFNTVIKELNVENDVLLRIKESQGGYMKLAKVFYDKINRLEGDGCLHTYCEGSAVSSAALLFLFGQKRIMHPDAYLTFTYPYFSVGAFIGKSDQEIVSLAREGVEFLHFLELMILYRAPCLSQKVRNWIQQKEGELKFYASEACFFGLATDVAEL